MNSYLVDTIEDCLAKTKNNELCCEVVSPIELEKTIGLPGGNIFHNGLQMPFR